MMATDTDTHPAGSHGADAHHVAHDEHGTHWSDWQYVQLAIGLAIVTAVEVLLSYIKDDMGPAFMPILLALMIFKFFAVVLFFMHLRFDNKIFSVMFYMGLVLAVGVYIVAMLTFHVFSS